MGYDTRIAWHASRFNYKFNKDCIFYKCFSLITPFLPTKSIWKIQSTLPLPHDSSKWHDQSQVKLMQLMQSIKNSHDNVNFSILLIKFWIVQVVSVKWSNLIISTCTKCIYTQWNKKLLKPQKLVQLSGCNQHILKPFLCQDETDLAFQAQPVNEIIGCT